MIITELTSNQREAFEQYLSTLIKSPDNVKALMAHIEKLGQVSSQ